MNLQDTLGWLQAGAFQILTATLGCLPGGRIRAFGSEPWQIGSIIVINLDRQPSRMRRTLRELNRFKTASGSSLTSITSRLAAIDARDGRGVASTADVDPAYLLGDQLHVQPDERLEQCFGVHQPVTMTRQEIAVARSHIEAWKRIATGNDENVLILEDDIWFRPGARSAIDRGWMSARNRFSNAAGPDLLYISYLDANGTAERRDVCKDLFRPERGLWFLSGYVLSRNAAHKLLLAMPVKGPVDMWMNRRFDELQTLALTTPAILQRSDGGSDNSYSVMPYLARAGVIDADAATAPRKAEVGPLFVWCDADAKESVAMALSMLGLRVRVFDASEARVDFEDAPAMLSDFDALIEPRFETGLLEKLANEKKLKFLLDRMDRCPLDLSSAPQTITATVSFCASDSERWAILCDLLGLAMPTDPFPVGAPSVWRLFRDDRDKNLRLGETMDQFKPLSDNSAWAIVPAPGWPADPVPEFSTLTKTDALLNSSVRLDWAEFETLEETFPGNLASFDRQGISRYQNISTLTLQTSSEPKFSRLYRSGALASPAGYQHGRFEADIRAAGGSGLVTGFFLHRADPRQEIDFEITGDDPTSVLLNVYFNPGDTGTSAAYGYRGSPCRIPLGFDASAEFHRYSIEWMPDSITWAVDGCVVHRRGSWDPTPIPHLPMKLHCNLWAPRSSELAGQIEPARLPVAAAFKNVQIRGRRFDLPSPFAASAPAGRDSPTSFNPI